MFWRVFGTAWLSKTKNRGLSSGLSTSLRSESGEVLEITGSTSARKDTTSGRLDDNKNPRMAKSLESQRLDDRVEKVVEGGCWWREDGS